MKIRIIPWVMTWDGIVTKTHKYYLKELGINNQIEAYMQSMTIKKTLESISLDYRRGGEICVELSEEPKKNDAVGLVVMERVSEVNLALLK